MAIDAEHINLVPTSSQNSYWMQSLDLSVSRQVPFLLYAARNWSIHLFAAQATGFEPMEGVKLSALSLCDSNSQHFRL